VPVGQQAEEPALAVVLIGMSAGALSPLRSILDALPRPFPAAIVIAQHVAPPSILPQLIRCWTARDVEFARAGDVLREDSIRVCPAQHHVIVNADGTFGLSTIGRLGYVRPSIDWLFESAAASYGPRAIAVVLSGSNGDGSRGADLVARAGGSVIVQAPLTCERPEMPLATMQSGVRLASLCPSEIAGELVKRATEIRATLAHAWQDPFLARAI
jgi:two-component system, chemotaxis family, protein-glutamate methylesterase/glutaminase